MCVDEAMNEAVAATRKIAKRQLTWLRRRETRAVVRLMHQEVHGK